MLELGRRLASFLARFQIRTFDDLEAHGVDGLAALGLGEQAIATLARSLRRHGRELPGCTLAGNVPHARVRCPVCGWRGLTARWRVGKACPSCGASTLGPRTGRPAKAPGGTLVRVTLYVPAAQLERAVDGCTGRARSRRLRALLTLGMRAEAASVDTARPRGVHGFGGC